MTRIIGPLLAICALSISQAAADSTEGHYLAIVGGVHILQDADVEVSVPGQPSIDVELLFDTGWSAGAALGYGWANGFSVEGEITYRENGIKGAKVMGTSTDLDGSNSSYAAMINARYGIDTGTAITPYVGAGVGAALLKLDVDEGGGGDFQDEDTEFAYQAMAGLSYALTPKLNLGFEYRYFAVNDPRFNIDTVNLDMEYHSHDVFMRMIYALQ